MSNELTKIQQWKKENIYGLYTPDDNDIDELIAIVRDQHLARIAELEDFICQVAALGSLSESYDSSISHKSVCARYKELMEQSK